MDYDAILRLITPKLPDASMIELLLHGQCMTRYEVNTKTGVVDAVNIPHPSYRATPAEIEARINALKLPPHQTVKE